MIGKDKTFIKILWVVQFVLVVLCFLADLGLTLIALFTFLKADDITHGDSLFVMTTAIYLAIDLYIPLYVLNTRYDIKLFLSAKSR